MKIKKATAFKALVLTLLGVMTAVAGAMTSDLVLRVQQVPLLYPVLWIVGTWAALACVVYMIYSTLWRKDKKAKP